jgi:hypothetical protein
MAERDGVPMAAIAVRTGAAIADPLVRSAGAVHAPRLRRYQLLRRHGRVAPAWTLLRRPVPTTEAEPPADIAFTRRLVATTAAARAGAATSCLTGARSPAPDRSCPVSPEAA